MSTVVLVDDKDTVIGLKSRNELTPEDIFRVSTIWIENSQGQVLLAQRSLTKSYGAGLWGPAAAGTIEDGETYESNAYKELEEEIGISDLTLDYTGKQLYRHADGEGRWFSFYRGVLDKPAETFVLQTEEVEAVAWFDKAQLFADLKQNPAKYVPSAVLWPEVFAN